MQLLRTADVPAGHREQIYDYSRWRAALGGAIVFFGAVGASAFLWPENSWIAYAIPAMVLPLLFIFQNYITARFRPSNWLVRMTDDGLYIKFRSYLNHRFPEQDLTVVFLPYSEIRSAKMITERREVPSLDGRKSSAMKKQHLLALELAVDSTVLAAALDNERERVFNHVNRGGGANTRYYHLPVHLASPTLLTIEWGVVPSLETLLDALTRHTLVRGGEEAVKDLAHLDDLSREQQESRLLELAESGDRIGAIKLARQIYSYDLASAKDFVESLIQKATKPAAK